MVNFGGLAAEIVSLVLGTPANFNGFRVSGSVTAQPNCGVEQRAPPVFGRAAITLGIGPHSSYGRFLDGAEMRRWKIRDRKMRDAVK